MYPGSGPIVTAAVQILTHPLSALPRAVGILQKYSVAQDFRHAKHFTLVCVEDSKGAGPVPPPQDWPSSGMCRVQETLAC